MRFRKTVGRVKVIYLGGTLGLRIRIFLDFRLLYRIWIGRVGLEEVGKRDTGFL